MKTKLTLLRLLFSAFATLAIAQDDPPIPADEMDVPEGVEVLTRGPLHEAFANPVTGELKPGLVVPKQPPDPIDEVPPDVRPDGDDVVWISGYWSWDDEREDFIWISGIWRHTPPNQRWVPGYWDKVDDGWRWTPGFWAPAEEEAITYYDPPPATLETGPSSPAPSEEHFWTPGVWTYYDTGYRWRPGYWARSQPDWVWMPDRWVWTPSGAVFVPGYWDYALTARGNVFSPVYIQPAVYAQSGFAYTPQYTLNPAALLVNFWIRPNYGHYYFGNYYGGNYGRWGFSPMAQYYNRRGGWGWDPIVAYNQAYFSGRGINFIAQLGGWHNFYMNNPASRPPMTWREQVNIINQQNITVNKITNITNVTQLVKNDIRVGAKSGGANVIALPVKQVAKAHRDDRYWIQMNQQQRNVAREHAHQIQQANAQRMKAEKEHAITWQEPEQNKGGKTTKPAQVLHTVKLPPTDHAVIVRPGFDKKPDVNERSGRDPVVNRPNSKPADQPHITRPPPGRPDGKANHSDDQPSPKPNVHPKLEPNVDRPTPKPNVNPKPEPKVERPQPKPEPRVEQPKPKLEPKVERPRLKPEPKKPEPKKPDPKPQPRIQPQPQPRPQPKPQPEVERPQPKPQPKVERPPPRPEPKPPAPRDNGLGKGKKDKEKEKK
jgi:hypothetical protein